MKKFLTALCLTCVLLTVTESVAALQKAITAAPQSEGLNKPVTEKMLD